MPIWDALAAEYSVAVNPSSLGWAQLPSSCFGRSELYPAAAQAIDHAVQLPDPPSFALAQAAIIALLTGAAGAVAHVESYEKAFGVDSVSGLVATSPGNPRQRYPVLEEAFNDAGRTTPTLVSMWRVPHRRSGRSPEGHGCFPRSAGKGRRHSPDTGVVLAHQYRDRRTAHRPVAESPPCGGSTTLPSGQFDTGVEPRGSLEADGWRVCSGLGRWDEAEPSLANCCWVWPHRRSSCRSLPTIPT